jgi:hypothetical protein
MLTEVTERRRVPAPVFAPPLADDALDACLPD